MNRHNINLSVSVYVVKSLVFKIIRDLRVFFLHLEVLPPSFVGNNDKDTTSLKNAHQKMICLQILI